MGLVPRPSNGETGRRNDGSGVVLRWQPGDLGTDYADQRPRREPGEPVRLAQGQQPSASSVQACTADVAMAFRR